MLNHVSLRHLVPFIFFGSGLVLALAYYLVGEPLSREQVRRFAEHQADLAVQALQSRVNQDLYNHNAALIQQEIFFTASDPNVKAVYILDQKGVVHYAHRTLQVGMHISDLPYKLDPALLDESANTGESRIQWLMTDTYVAGIAGLGYFGSSSASGYRLVMVTDVSDIFAKVLGIASLPAEILASVIILITMLMAAIIGYKIRTRLVPLLGGMRDLAGGMQGVRVPLKGDDEFSDMASAFNHMAEQIDENRSALATALTKAERANIDKNDFLRNVSRNVRTPLASVVGFLDLLDTDDLPLRARRFLDAALGSARTLKGLIDSLVDMEDLGIENVKRINKPLSFSNLVDSALETLSEEIAARQLSIVVEKPDDDAGLWIENDIRILRQIVMGLISNAVRYTQVGEVTIRCEHERKSKLNTEIRFSVTDTGVGIPQSQISRLFRANKLIDNSQILTQSYATNNSASSSKTAHAWLGPGLSLPLVKVLCDAINAQISVESTLGLGSRFTITFESQIAAPRTLEQIAQFTQPLQHALEILVVEDTPSNQLLIRTILKRWGYKPVCVNNGEAAIAEMRRRIVYANLPPIDLILMDIHMPDKLGTQVLQEVRALSPAYKRLPVIALTADTGHSGLKTADSGGFDAVLAKPIDTSQLAGEIFRLTRLRRQQRAADEEEGRPHHGNADNSAGMATSARPTPQNQTSDETATG